MLEVGELSLTIGEKIKELINNKKRKIYMLGRIRQKRKRAGFLGKNGKEK
jgi:hypothetical protein